MLRVLNRSRSTLSNVNLTLHLMLSDGWRKGVAQCVGLGFQLHVRELEDPTLEMAVERGVAGDRCDDWPIRRGLGARARREETKCEGGYGWASRDSGVSCLE